MCSACVVWHLCYLFTYEPDAPQRTSTRRTAPKGPVTQEDHNILKCMGHCCLVLGQNLTLGVSKKKKCTMGDFMRCVLLFGLDVADWEDWGETPPPDVVDQLCFRGLHEAGQKLLSDVNPDKVWQQHTHTHTSCSTHTHTAQAPPPPQPCRHHQNSKKK